jgi:Tfp pilus assembly protein PilF
VLAIEPVGYDFALVFTPDRRLAKLRPWEAFVRIVKLLVLACLHFPLSGFAEHPNNEAAEIFADGMRLFEAKDYAEAATTLDSAVAIAPTNDHYFHWRGRAYGRLAEQASWFSAIKYAKLTRASLERAVQINPNNPAAVADLAQYYTQAPSFLGGDKAKAEALRAHLKTLPTTVAPIPH